MRSWSHTRSSGTCTISTRGPKYFTTMRIGCIGAGYWRGKDQIKAGTKEIHRTYYRNSRMTPQRVEDLTFLSPDIALAHVRSELTGDERAPGETFQYRKSALFTRKAGAWRIRALHNTRIRPNAIAADVQ
jgi:uncharacterized protein (TIGR02246 family)